MIAGLELTHHGGGDRRHAARRRPRRLGPFEHGHPRLEHGDGRVREARINVTWIGAFEPRLGGLHGLVDETLGQKERLRGLVERRAQRSAMDQRGRGAHARGRFCGLGHRTRSRDGRGFAAVGNRHAGLAPLPSRR